MTDGTMTDIGLKDIGLKDAPAPDRADPWDCDIREVVALPEWQALRKDLVGTWAKTPVGNVLLLRSFLGDGKDGRRVRILLNYLTGTSFRIGRVSHREIDRLLAEVRGLAERQTLHLKGRVIR
jgi:hypothetical protein